MALTRRYKYDVLNDRVVEIGQSPRGVAEHEKLDIRETREGALERADRREWAHKRFGDERRWRE